MEDPDFGRAAWSTNKLCHVQVNMRTGGVESEANVTDIHEALHFDVMEERDSGYHHSFGIWSLRWGSDGREIVAGTGDHSLYVYNVERQKVSFCHLDTLGRFTLGNAWGGEGVKMQVRLLQKLLSCVLVSAIPGMCNGTARFWSGFILRSCHCIETTSGS